MKIIIPLPPVTKKNNPQILYNHKTGKPFVAPSKQYQQYERDAKWFIPKLDTPIDEPVNVKCLFFTATNGRVDQVNLLSAICDILVKYGVLADDNSDIVVSHDGSRVYKGDLNPRTEIYITKKR